MSSDAIKAQGTTVSWNAVNIGDVLDISGPSESVSVIDVTDFDSTIREKMAGLPDGGQVTLNCNLDPGDTAQTNLRTDMRAGTERAVVITLTDTGATTATFNALCTGMSPSGSVDGKMTHDITLEVTSSPVWA